MGPEAGAVMVDISPHSMTPGRNLGSGVVLTAYVETDREADRKEGFIIEKPHGFQISK